MAKTEEKRKNCQNCNKSMQRVSWYYRNNGYFCNKSCFQSFAKKQQKEKEAASGSE
jgi:hypothetical protein